MKVRHEQLPLWNPVEAYLERLAPGTARVMEERLRSLARELGVEHRSFGWHELVPDRLAGIRDGLLAAGVAAGTVNVALAAVRGVARTARDLGIIGAARCGELGRVRNAPTAPDILGRALSHRELSALFAACAQDHSAAGGRDQAILAAMYAGGMRAGELSALELGDWTAEPPGLRVRVGRGHALRTVLLGPRGADAVAGWVALRGSAPGRLFLPVSKGGAIAAERLRGGGVRTMLRKRAEDAGIARLTAHDVRHSAIRDLWRAGASILTVMRVVGGASAWTLERYCRSGVQDGSRIGRSKERGRTAYHRWEPAEQEPDVLALLRR
ncbi:MAG: site-specific integrase [Chloroflexota bacterium]|nr:site-specific integrase [Chloroflexota bacterium]